MPGPQTKPELQQRLSDLEVENRRLVEKLIVAEGPKRPMTLFRVVGTILVEKDGRFLITKRSPSRPVFPSLWTIPGGGLELSDFEHLPCDYQPNQWYGVLEVAMRRELKEETGLTVGVLTPITDLVFLMPDKTPVITFSWLAPYESGEVTLSPEDVDYAWILATETDSFELIPGIPHEIEMAHATLARLKGGE